MAQMLGVRRASQAALPLIDMAGLWSSRPSFREAAGRKLREACIDKGFFYIANHGVPAGLIDAVFAESKHFFDQPIETKRQVDKSKSVCHRGYDAFREQILEAGTPPDLKEGFYIGLDLPEDDPRVRAGKFNHGPNIWPTDLPSFRPTMAAYLAAIKST